MTPHKNNPYVHPHYVPVLKSVIEHLYTVGMPKTWSEQRQAAADIYQNHGYASPFPLDLVTARKRLMASIRMNQIPNWVKEDEELQPKYQHVVSQAKNCYRGIVVAKSEVQTDDDEYGGGWLNNTEEQSADEELQFDFDNPRVLTKKRAILKPKRFVDEGDTPFAPSERCIIRRLETAPIKQLPDEAEDMPVVEEKAVKLEQSPQPEQQEMPTVQQVMPVAEIPSEQDELEAAKAELENLKAIVAEQEEEIGELRQQLEVSEGIIDDFKVECHEKQIEIEWLKVHKGFDPATMKYDENPIHSYLEELKAAEEKNLAEMERQKLHFDYLVDETRAQETDLQAQNQAITGQLLLIRTLQNKFFAATMGSDFEIPFADTADDDDILLTPQTSIERRISLPETPTIPEQTSGSPQPLLEDSEIFQTTPSLPNPRTSPMHQNDDQHVPAGEAHSTTSIDTNHSFV